MKPGASLRQGAPRSPNGAAARDSDSTADTVDDGKAAPKKPDEGAKNADDDAKPPAVRNLDAVVNDQRLSIDSDSKFFPNVDGTWDEEEEKVDDAIVTPAPTKSGAGLQKSDEGGEELEKTAPKKSGAAKSPAEVSTGSAEELETLKPAGATAAVDNGEKLKGAPKPACAKAAIADAATAEKLKGAPKASGAKSPAEVTVNSGDLETPTSAGSLADRATAKKKPWARKGPGAKGADDGEKPKGEYPNSTPARSGAKAPEEWDTAELEARVKSIKKECVAIILGGDLPAADAFLVKATNELSAKGLPIDHLELTGTIGFILGKASTAASSYTGKRPFKQFLNDLIIWMCNLRSAIGVILLAGDAGKLLKKAAALNDLALLMPSGTEAPANYDLANVFRTGIIPSLVAGSEETPGKARDMVRRVFQQLRGRNKSSFVAVEETSLTRPFAIEEMRRTLPGNAIANVASYFVSVDEEGNVLDVSRKRQARALFTLLTPALMRSWNATEHVVLAITYQPQTTFDKVIYLLKVKRSKEVADLLTKLEEFKIPVFKAQGSANEPQPKAAAAKQVDQAGAPGTAAAAAEKPPADKRAAPDAAAPPQAGAKAPPQAAKPPAEEPAEEEAETPQPAEEAAAAESPAAEPAAAEAVARPPAGNLQPVEEAAGAGGGRGEGDGMSIRPVVKTRAGDDYKDRGGDRACTDKKGFLCPNPHGWCNAKVPFSTDTYCLKCWLICGYCSDIGVFYSHYRGGGIVTHEGRNGLVVQKPAGGDWEDRGGDPACTSKDPFLCPNPYGCNEMVPFRTETYCPRCKVQCGYAHGRVFYSYYRGGGLAYHKG